MTDQPGYNGSPLGRVTVDNHPIELPEWLSDSLTSIKTYLECLAIRKERVLWALQVNGAPIDLADTAVPVDASARIQARTITFDELGRRLVTAGRRKLDELRRAIEEAVLLVLINDWNIAEGLWHEWEQQFREPLLSLRAVRELRLEQHRAVFDHQPLGQHVQELDLIVHEIEDLFSRPEAARTETDLVTFSEILEFTALTWLNRLASYFDQLDPSRDQSRR